MFAEIVGTKEYRKPEWVTHMEELKSQLQGNGVCSVSPEVSPNTRVALLPTDRLSVCPNTLHPCHSTGELSPHSRSSSSSNVSEPVDKASHGFKISLKRISTVECLQSGSASRELSCDSLEKRETRNSESWASFVGLSAGDDSVFLSTGSSGSGEPVSPFLLHPVENVPVAREETQDSNSSSDFEFIEAECAAAAEAEAEAMGLLESRVDSPEQNGFCILSPIQEKSEASSNSSRFSEERPLGRLLSYSLSAMGAGPRDAGSDAHLRCQTFPRVSTPMPRRSITLDRELYPLEPRELDPSCFHQLHAADSQEELQEFLLLESECMNLEESRGLASAFTPPESGEEEASQSQGK